MAALPENQVRALYPDRSAFVDRHGRGPQSLRALRTVLSETRRRGYATEDGEITPGFASVAVAVLDHNGTPLGGIATHLRRPRGRRPPAPGRGRVHDRTHREPTPRRPRSVRR